MLRGQGEEEQEEPSSSSNREVCGLQSLNYVPSSPSQKKLATTPPGAKSITLICQGFLEAPLGNPECPWLLTPPRSTQVLCTSEWPVQGLRGLGSFEFSFGLNLAGLFQSAMTPQGHDSRRTKGHSNTLPAAATQASGLRKAVESSAQHTAHQTHFLPQVGQASEKKKEPRHQEVEGTLQLPMPRGPSGL